MRIFSGIFLLLLLTGSYSSVQAQAFYPFALVLSMLEPNEEGDSTDLRYPIQDNREAPQTNPPPASIDLKDPKSVETKVVYDPVTRTFTIYEKIGDQYFRYPKTMTFQEYTEYQRKKSEQDYFEMRSKAVDLAERRTTPPKLYDGPELFDKGFGYKPKIEIKPQGNVDVTLGVISQKIDNPVLPLPQRKQTNFDFDMNIQLNLTGQIGDMMKLNTNFNTKATFNFENQVKLGYKGKEDNIIQEISAGNVSLPLRGSLIRGNQSLFGVKTQLKFGRLLVTNIMTQQKSQAENIRIEGGAQTRSFEIKVDDYEDNRHFYLAQYFRSNYENFLSRLPNITSPVVINRLDVWVTNKTRQTEDIREVLALADLGEKERIGNPAYLDPAGSELPANSSNLLYGILTSPANSQNLRDPNTVFSLVENQLGLRSVDDFEKTSARKLAQTEYYFNPQLGYLSLNQSLKTDEVLAVAVEYTVNGTVYRIGEFAGDVPPNTDTTNIKDKVLVLKLLKSTSIRTSRPYWDLMMKNVYSLNAFQVTPENFILDIYYKDPGGGQKRYLPDGGDIANQQLLRVLNLDNTNNQLDPQPDGRFDFIPNVTINARNGKIYFPVVEPFGDYLRKKINNDDISKKYVFDLLYDSTKFNAQQRPEFNRYIIKGSYRSSVSSEIKLGGFNLPPGSVIVTAGGQQLTENVDYEVNYSLGTVRILNDGILNSGVPVDVKFENNILFGVQNRSLIGTRLDYTINPNFTLGATHMRLSEKPFTQKVNIGDDPIRNNIIGFDFNYAGESKGITRIFNKITAQDTKAPSKITVSGEFAKLIPGTARGINLNNEPTVYIDDFEGTSINYDLRFPFNAWQISGAPIGMTDEFGTVKYPEARLFNDLTYGFNRAKLSWYQIDNVFYNSRNNPLDGNRQEQEGIYTRLYYEKQIFPNRQNENLRNAPLFTFDLNFDPSKRGPYNFETNGVPGVSAGVDAQGKLRDPKTRWGGIMRIIETTNDFEAANIEFIQFWVLDPFLKTPGNKQGNLYIHLGMLSEDILKDSRKQYENGLPRPGVDTRLDSSVWGFTPRIPNAITNSFDANPDVIVKQDVGLDGMDDEKERSYYSNFLTTLQALVNPEAFDEILNDPSGDNYRYSLDGRYGTGDGILRRYQDFNGTQGNSSNNTGAISGTTGNSKNTPDDEDLNRDNTLNQTEEYYQYRLDLSPQGLATSSFVTDKQVVLLEVNGVPDSAVWYQVRIPVTAYEQKVGNIPDFRSVRYVRLVMDDFEQPAVLRFAELSLVRNQWRRYLFNLGEPGETLPNDDVDNTNFAVTSVSVEQNSSRVPIPYAIPPGISREQTINGYYNALQNEQALSVSVCELKDGDARAVYKLGNLDLRLFQRLRMFIHAEGVTSARGQQLPLNNGDVTAFMRLGADFSENYYEYEIPLNSTPVASYNPNNDNDRRAIWPEANELDVAIDTLTKVKQLRNNRNIPLNQPFTYIDGKGRKITVRGNPDLGQSSIMMLGVRNPSRVIGLNDETDDGQPKCAEIWFNELRLSDLDQQGGVAALGRADIQLGSLGNVSVSGSMHTIGFGNIEQQLRERYRDNFLQYDIAANLDLGKLIPEKVGLEIPVYANFNQSISTPQYDPYELDITLKDKLQAVDTDPALTPTEKNIKKEEIKAKAQDVTGIKSINVTNMRKVRTNQEATPRVYDIENFDITYAYTEVDRRTPIIEDETLKRHKFALGYNYNPKTTYIQPFKNIKNNHKYLRPIKEFNINPKPNSISFRSDINRQFGSSLIRDIGDDGLKLDPTFNKYFTWERFYTYKHNLTKSLNFDFVATNRSRIDEPFGYIDTDAKRDTLRRNFWDFGRTVNYLHTFNANYTLPLQFIPVLDWVTLRGRYSADYSWTTAPLSIPEWGNIIANGMNLQVNGEFNFRNLYQKLPFLKPYTMNEPKKKKEDFETAMTKYEDNLNKLLKKKEDKIKALENKILEIEKAKLDTTKTEEDIKNLILAKKEIKNQLRKFKDDKAKISRPGNPTADIFIRPLLMIQRASITYDSKRTTALPGFLPSPQVLGQSFDQSAPGFSFLFGGQKDTTWLRGLSEKGLLTTDTIFNNQFQQTKTNNLNIRLVLEPFRDFRVDINIQKQQTETYSEFFKRPDQNSGFQHLNPRTGGSYTVSFVMLRTIFDKVDENNFSNAFRKFEQIRAEFSQLLGNQNPNSGTPFINPDSLIVDGFLKGYGPYSQNVLIPSLIAAYSGKDVDKVKLNPLKTIPLPNWRITYNGIAKTNWGKKLFTNFNISHAYNSTFTVSSYTSDLNFVGTPGFDPQVQYFVPSALDSLSGNFYNLYYIPQLTISEQFAPLIGIEATWKNSLLTNFEFKKSRSLGLSLLDFQLSETRSTEIVAGLGYTLVKFKLPFKFGKKGERKVLNNDVNLRCDLSIRTDKSVNYRLGQNVAEPTRGARTISFSPTIDYVINKRLNIRIFYDFRKTVPATLAAYPITNSRGGITLRFSLAP